jgi:hypothetical protein
MDLTIRDLSGNNRADFLTTGAFERGLALNIWKEFNEVKQKLSGERLPARLHSEWNE